MKNMLSLALLLSVFNLSFAWATPEEEAKATYKDIKETLGIVPSFLQSFPESGITGAWMDMKGIQLNAKSAIPGKYKELIGLAVAAQVPCNYCTYFHTEAAKLSNVTPQELSEAIALAAGTRRYSTYFAGTQDNLGRFKKEIDRMLKFTHSKKNMQAMEAQPKTEEAPLVNAADAYQDMKLTLGFVPEFIKAYPQNGVAGLWREMKGVSMNPNSVIPGKYKNLIELAVAAQTPCPQCVYYSTQSAMKLGATKSEIHEAIAMAGITREWSTVLNGHETDLKSFRKETDQIMKFLKGKMPKEVGVNN